MSIAFVQKLPSHALASGTSLQSAAFSANPTLNNRLIATYTFFSNSSNPTVTFSDTAGNSWVNDVSIQRLSSAGNYEHSVIASTQVSLTGASFKVTVTTSGATTVDNYFDVCEFSGIATGSQLFYLDSPSVVTGSNPNSTTSLTLPTSNSANYGELLIMVLGIESSTTTDANLSHPALLNGSQAGVVEIDTNADGSTINGGQFSYILLGGPAGNTIKWNYSNDANAFAQYTGAAACYIAGGPTSFPLGGLPRVQMHYR